MFSITTLSHILHQRYDGNGDMMNQRLLPALSKSANSLDGKWIGQLLEQLGEVIDKAKRIHFKSLGGILALQEKLAEQWPAPGRCPG